jgi:prepilin-type N-terminal cleavage/methylation domain-containing protein
MANNNAFRAGFTLLEVLVSSAVLAIVLAIMFSALSTSMNLWRNTDNKIVSDREARAVEMMLARDLANVIIPASADLRPKIATNRLGRANVYYLKFLTAVPSEMQSASGGVGDVCYVEYAVLPSTNGPGSEVRRLFWPSTKTLSDVITAGAFPSAPQAPAEYQSLGINLLPTNTMAARGLGALPAEANNTNFVLLGTNMLPFTGTPGTNNYPVAIEVNFAVADPDTLANSNIISSANYIMRNAGLYSFRIPLPKPPNAP